MFGRQKKFKKGAKVQVIGRSGAAGLNYLSYGRVTNPLRGGLIGVTVKDKEIFVYPDDLQSGE